MSLPVEDLKELKESIRKKSKEMDWNIIGIIAVSVFLGFMLMGIVAVVAYGNDNKVTFVLQDLNSSLNTANGKLDYLYLGEIELAKGLQDINARIVLNEQALQSLDYLTQNCDRQDANEYFVLKCWK